MSLNPDVRGSALAGRIAERLNARLQQTVRPPVALALSGGGDSMALLEVASDWARSAGRRLVAITVDHGLSPTSRDWSRTCARAAGAAGADWLERRWNGDKPVTGLPAAARRARHALIAEAAREVGAKVVLLAHTADDVAESDWMRSRGSTLGGLREWSPSPAWPEGRGLMLLRPMLGERREDLREWLGETGRDWIEDPGNADARFARSRARVALNPLPEGEGLRLAERSDAPSRKGEGRGLTGTHHTPHPFAQERRHAVVRSSPLPLGEGYEVDRSVRLPDLAAMLLCASGSTTPPRGDRLERLTARLNAGEDFTATLAGARIEARGTTVTVGREAGELRRRPAPDIALQPGVSAVWDGRYEITAREPDWIVTAAIGRLNALSRPDRAIVNTIPAWARGALPVLIRDGAPAPVLAWRQARVRSLAPRRLSLALGETTQESDLDRTIHGETAPPDLF
ncbi:MAG: tRNA lysidine(34) synthetase TilS [Brevundimonas sp.]|uniref:tRNA lysidine(34) synthetase TilS n=1 Tax=Brevundimonas sp. TaxID=1871086 RepID=UPI002733596E|nr:tRNA lysidine(34) synthetase TilS [Brevundimonas sp.]MDP3403296.1 tRNA lysidine(34) synthetase TilS [Brevundimonas sp.]